MNGYNIPVGISEDWDRTAASSNAVAMNATDGSGLADVGKKVKANTDIVHAHIMPYYHPDEVVYAAKSWGYVDHYLAWLNEYVGQPVMVTEVSLAAEVRSVEPELAAEADFAARRVHQTMWSSAVSSSHQRGGDSTAEAQATFGSFKSYWNLFSNNCATFK